MDFVQYGNAIRKTLQCIGAEVLILSNNSKCVVTFLMLYLLIALQPDHVHNGWHCSVSTNSGVNHSTCRNAYMSPNLPSDCGAKGGAKHSLTIMSGRRHRL